MRTPSAFVSYSRESPDHEAWVERFAARLRRDGVDAKLDKWELRLGDPITHFMEAAVRDNDFVLMVCTPIYKQRADQRRGGVGYEGGIITAELYRENKNKHRKFIPILRSGTWDEAFPTFLTTKLGIDLVGNPYSEDQYGELLDALFERTPGPPPIGPISPPSRTTAASSDVGVTSGKPDDSDASAKRSSHEKRSSLPKTWLRLTAMLVTGVVISTVVETKLPNVAERTARDVSGGESGSSPVNDQGSSAGTLVSQPAGPRYPADNFKEGVGETQGGGATAPDELLTSQPQTTRLGNRDPQASQPDAQQIGDPSLMRLEAGGSSNPTVLRSITDLVSTDGVAIYFDPQRDLPGACPGGAIARFNGAGGLASSERVPCEDGRLVFRPMSLSRWDSRINPNTGHCVTFVLGDQSVYYPTSFAQSLPGADRVVTPEGVIGFRIEHSVTDVTPPRVVLTNSPGTNGSTPCSV